jgi:hypothetical protein
MRRTLFEAGFNSPTHAYGIVPPAQMGSLWSDVKGFFQSQVAPKPATPAPPPPPPPAPSGTVLGIPTEYVVVGGVVALILGIAAAVMGSKKKGPAPVPAKPAVGRRHHRR